MEAAFDSAIRNPEDPNLRAEIVDAAASGSPAQREFVSAYDAMVDQGRFGVARSSPPNSVTTESGPQFTPDRASAFVVVCAVSGDRLAERPATPGGEPAFLSDAVNVRRMVQTFVLEDEVWKLFDRRLIADYPGSVRCS